MITVRCECARVKYQVDGELKDSWHCHCSISRRLHGAAFATRGGISSEKLGCLLGENHLKADSYSARADSIFATIVNRGS
jgi:hypothetical protein